MTILVINNKKEGEKFMGRVYSWEEVVSKTISTGNKCNAPNEKYKNCQFIKKEVPTSKIKKTYYLTLAQCKKLNFVEEICTIRNLIHDYQSDSVPPIILNEDYSIIDGARRMGAIMELGREKVEAFVLFKKN